MDRLTFEGNFCDISRCEGEYRMTSLCADGACDARKVWEKLKAYEDTGLEPEEIAGREAIYNEILTRTYGPMKQKFVAWMKANQEKRLVVLDEPMRPLVWGDKDHDTILCPRCQSDLMGGFQYAISSEEKMYQCPHCGCPVDTTKAEDMVED